MNLKSGYNYASGLSKVPRSGIFRDEFKSNTTKILTLSDSSNRFWYLPLQINNSIEPFVFDTGASNSFVTKAFAKKHKINILSDSIIISGATGGRDYVSLGIIDTIKIANITYTNLPVYIGDISLPKEINEKFEAVLGLPFMEAVEEFSINPANMEMTFKLNFEEIPQNMMCFGGRLFVETYYNDLRLLLFCDTGATTDVCINKNTYTQNYNRFASFVSSRDSLRSMGFGGNVTRESVLNIHNMPLRIGPQLTNCAKVQIMNSCANDGEIGIDFFKRQREIIFNFKKMYLIIK